MQIRDRKVLNCSECEFKKMFDYGNKIYYCDNEDRSDDIGKLGVGNLPKTSPVWCPLRINNCHCRAIKKIKVEKENKII